MSRTSLTRRWTSTAAAALLVVVGLSACGSDSKETTPAATEAPASVETTAAAAETTVAAATETTAAPAETTAAAAGDLEAGSNGEINVFLIPSPSSTAIQSFIPAFEKFTCTRAESPADCRVGSLW